MAAVQPRIVIVPRQPGLLREHQPRSQRQPDELDDVIDGIFGPSTDERPGWFDAGLVVVGFGLAAWAVIGDGSSLMLLIGIASIVLGLALPARVTLRRLDTYAAGLRSRMVERGTPLDASHPATLALIGSHARLMQASSARTARDPKRAVSVGHAAVMEVSQLLEGRPPGTPAEIRLVWIRTAALNALTDQMLRLADRRPALTASQWPARVPRAPAPPPQIPVQFAWMRPRTAEPPHPGHGATRPRRSSK